MTDSPPTQPVLLTTARLISGAMMLGVTLFWIVTLVITKGHGGAASTGARTTQLLFYLWVVLAAAGFAVALKIQRDVSALGERARTTTDQLPNLAGVVQSKLIIAWASLEGPAMLAGVFFLIFGARSLMAPSLIVFFIGMVLTFPRSEWYGINS